MTDERARCLDPRLRQLMDHLDDPEALADDVRTNRVTAASDQEITAESLTSHVLVRLSGEPPQVRGSRWTQVAPGIYAVDLPVTELGALADHPAVQYVEAGSTLGPQLDTSIGETGTDALHTAHPELTGRGVVVGIIDYGLDYTLDDFRNEDGTSRVAFLWDQRLRPLEGERSPARFGFGVEYDADAIDAALQAELPFSVVRHRPQVEAHGTHVAGIAAGNGRSGDNESPAGRFAGVAPEATIVFVQPAFGDEAGSLTNSARVATAVAYVYAKARELGLPCVINMSLSQNGGSHDGASVLEQTIDLLLEERAGRAFVHAAGNVQIWRNHASGQLAAGQTRTLRWRCGGGLPLPDGPAPAGPDPTPNEVEIWYSSRDTFAVRLIHPAGTASPVLIPDVRTAHRFADGTVALLDSVRFSPLNGDAQVFVSVQRGTAAAVTRGEWRLEITATEVKDGRFDAWIERDQQQPAHLQSFFVGDDFDPVMTLGTPATSRNGIAVANYDHVAQALQGSSSRGRTRDGRAKPEVAAPGVKIVAACALGGRPNGAGGTVPMRVAKTGTSMSAPHVAGIVALMLQRNPNLTTAQIRAALVASASQPDGVSGFDVGWGHGRVNAAKAVALLD